MHERACQKYNEIYLEALAREASSFVADRNASWSRGIALVARAEHEALPSYLASLEKAAKSSEERILLVANFNCSLASSQAERLSHDESLKLLGAPKNEIFHYKKMESFDLLSINLSGDHALPAEQGVGLARKIASDTLFSLWMKKRISCDFFLSNDADIEVPEDFFELKSTGGLSALCMDFEHKLENLAIAFYDSYLRYYRSGLAHSGSPYAFFTLGSNLAIDFESYAIVRGFPKRQAAEDFYLLNKLAKVKGVRDDQTVSPILISGRASNRVPFGTGASVQKLSEMKKLEQDYLVDAPNCFERLRGVHSALAELSVHCKTSDFFAALDPLSREFFEPSKKNLEGLLKDSTKASERHRKLETHFDSFRSMKLVHHFEKRGIERVPLANLQCSFFNAPLISENSIDKR